MTNPPVLKMTIPLKLIVPEFVFPQNFSQSLKENCLSLVIRKSLRLRTYAIEILKFMQLNSEKCWEKSSHHTTKIDYIYLPLGWDGVYWNLLTQEVLSGTAAYRNLWHLLVAAVGQGVTSGLLWHLPCLQNLKIFHTNSTKSTKSAHPHLFWSSAHRASMILPAKFKIFLNFAALL